jgi:cytochrome c2
MARWLLYGLTTVGMMALAALIGLIVFIYTGAMTPEKLRKVIKYNPLATTTQPVSTTSAIQTGLIRLKRRDISLPALGAGFGSGGGAFVQLSTGLLVAERGGLMFHVDLSTPNPTLRKTNIAIAINNAGYQRFAESQGYAVKPGKNVGYAGLGMRLHDLLLLSDNRRLMASFTRWDDAKNCAALHFAITDLDLSGPLPTVAPWHDVFQTEPCLGLSPRKSKPFAGHQAGGRMIELGGDRILVTVGDFKNDGSKRAITTADPNVDYGKTHVINLATGSVQRRFTTGHRNPQGLVRREDGALWSTEHGPLGGDEVNKLTAGQDYGWPRVTLGRDCSGCDWQIEGRHEGFEKPRWSYVPSIGISNLIEIQGFAPLWDGDLLVASLAGETLHRLRLDGDRVMYDEPIRIGDRIRDIAQLVDGRILLWTDAGKLVFLEAELAPSPAQQMLQALPMRAKEIVADCKVCHDLDPGAPRPGRISLWGVMDRATAAQAGVAYSDALKAEGGRWSNATLDRFLQSPDTAIPGTSMPYEGISDDAVRELIVDYLSKLKYQDR